MDKYTFDLARDPNNDEFFSIYLCNGKGGSAEVVGKIGSPWLAGCLMGYLEGLTQEEIKNHIIL